MPTGKTARRPLCEAVTQGPPALACDREYGHLGHHRGYDGEHDVVLFWRNEMAQPTNAEDYRKRFHENEKISGFGVGNVFVHMPCAFCAAPDFLVYEILDVERAIAEGGTCKECGRSMRAIVTRTADRGVSFEFVQTGGPDAPPWLQPAIRRVE